MQSGYQLSFFTSQDQKHDGVPLGEWLVQEARRRGMSGATLIEASEGFGHHKKLHSAHFFELTDQPVEVSMAVTAEEAEQLFARLEQANIRIFCIKMPIEFGFVGAK